MEIARMNKCITYSAVSCIGDTLLGDIKSYTTRRLCPSVYLPKQSHKPVLYQSFHSSRSGELEFRRYTSLKEDFHCCENFTCVQT